MIFFSDYLAFPRAVGIILVCFSCSVLLKYDLGDQAVNTYNIEYVIGGNLSKLSFSHLLVITQLICVPSAAFLTESNFLLLKSSASSSSFVLTS